MRKISFIVMMSMVVFGNAQSIVSDRPSQTKSATLVPLGSFQMESGVMAEFTPDGTKARTHILAPTNLFRYGLSEYFEFRMLSQFESNKSPLDESRTSGMSDLQVGTKIRLLDKEGVTTKVGFITHVVLPFGSRGVSADTWGGVNRLVISHTVTEKIEVGYNLGFNYYTTKNGDLTYAIALRMAVNDKLKIYIEPYGQYQRLQTYQANYDAGFTYLLKDNVLLDFSFGSGINHKMNYLATGISWNIAKKED